MVWNNWKRVVFSHLLIPRYSILAENVRIDTAKKMAATLERDRDVIVRKHEEDYGDFLIDWNVTLGKEGEKMFVQAIKKLLPSLDEAREFILKLHKQKTRSTVTIEHPFPSPLFQLEVFYDEEALAHGFFISRFFGNFPIGSIYFKHQKICL